VLFQKGGLSGEYFSQLSKIFSETVASQFEGSSAYSPPVLTETVTIGSAEAARLHIQAYFRELHDMLNMQENAALLTVDSYIREKLCFIRQNHEDLSVVVSQVSKFLIFYRSLIYL